MLVSDTDRSIIETSQPHCSQAQGADDARLTVTGARGAAQEDDVGDS